MKAIVSIMLLILLAGCGSTSQQSLPYDMTLANEGYEELIRQNYDQAEAWFDLALSINSQNPYALLNLGVVYFVGARNFLLNKRMEALDCWLV